MSPEDRSPEQNSHTTENSGCGSDDRATCTLSTVDRSMQRQRPTSRSMSRSTASRSLSTSWVTSGSSNRSARWSGSAGRVPVAASTASGNFAGWAVASADHRPRRSVGELPCRGDTGGGVRVEHHRRRGLRPPDLRGRRGVVEGGRAERALDVPRPLIGLDVEATGRAEPAELFGGHATVAAVHLEQQPLEVRRHLDVHRRAQRGEDVTRRHVADSTNRVRMSFVLEAITKSLIGAPISRAIQPASTLPKFPVGTLKRTGPVSVSAATT